MILSASKSSPAVKGKPRASGDDPVVGAVLDMVCV